MSDEPQVIRHEIMEERSNRDAFHALLIVSTLFALFLIALIIAAWNTRIVFLPLAPKSPAFSTPRAESAPSSKTAHRSATACGVDRFSNLAVRVVAVEQTCGPARASGGGRAAGPQSITRA